MSVFSSNILYLFHALYVNHCIIPFTVIFLTMEAFVVVVEKHSL